MKHIAGIIAFVCIISNVYAQNFENGFEFYLPYNDATAQEFLPYFHKKTIEHDEFVNIKNGHFCIKDSVVRFWGANLVAGGAFPLKDKSHYIASRMRKMGFNLIRFHHMDNGWSRESIFEWNQDTRHLNPTTLDRFEFLVNELKRNNIYTNINLHVSRDFKTCDGVSYADSIVNLGKGVTLFDPLLIHLQKEYARQLLTHINPYTGIPLVEDPVMAMVEITNENSLYRLWRDDKLRLQANGGDLCNDHVRMLNSMWHDYLIDKYATTASLRDAWETGARVISDEQDQIEDGNFEKDPAHMDWLLEQHNPARATAGIEVNNTFDGNFSARVVVEETDNINWHIQWKSVGHTIEKDSLYLVSFAARADGHKSIGISIMMDNSPWTTFFNANADLEDEWNVFQFSFKAPATCEGDVRFSFLLAGSTGQYWFDDIHFTPSPVFGLTDSESLVNRTIERILYTQSSLYTDQRVRDLSDFYLNLEHTYYENMSDFLKNELGVKVPIVGTNWNIGAPDMSVQSKLDYIDNHSYWNHPVFPNKAWDSYDWYIDNEPMVRAKNGGTIPNLFAGVGYLGKPFTVSEYNHPFPNRYQSEGVLFLTTYSSFQEVDGIMMFEYSGNSEDWETDFIDGYFSLHRNTAMMALMPSCARAFRNGYISGAKQMIEVEYSEEDILLWPRRDTRQNWWGYKDFPEKLALVHGVRHTGFNSINNIDPDNFPQEPANPYMSDTGEIFWDTDGLMVVSTDNFAGMTGFLNEFEGSRIGDHQLVEASDFCTFTWVTLTDDDLLHTEKSLLTLSSRIQNSGMVWDGETTVHNNWGEAPTELYPVAVVFDLAIPADSIRIIPLNEIGEPMHQGYVQEPEDGKIRVKLDQTIHNTIWFGLEAYGIKTDVDQNMKTNSLPADYKLFPNYPNPFSVSAGNSVTVLKFTLPFESEVRIDIYNLLGQRVRTVVHRKHKPGRFQAVWDGRDEVGNYVSSGIYLCRLIAKSEGIVYNTSQKMLFLN